MGSILDLLDLVSNLLNITSSSSKRKKIKEVKRSNTKQDLSKKVSIIMPVYNGEKYLEAAIDSIRNQTYKNWELIIINDGSTDNTENIINQYADDRIKYITNETNLGLIATLNKAIDFCKGEYIARMDADDICEKGRLSKQIDFLEAHPLVAMCGTNAIVIDENGNRKGNIINLSSNDYIQINLLFSVPIVHPSIVLRASVLKNNRYNSEYKHIEDYELWCRIADKYPISNLSSKLLKYRWHTTNISVQYNEEQEKLKDKIITNQLNKIGLSPSQEELYLHRVSYMQYDTKGDLEKQNFTNYSGLSTWFKKVIEANRKVERYDQQKLIAFLWSRWIVLCIRQKQYKLIFRSGFVPFNLAIYMKTFGVMTVLMKKK